MHRIALPTLVIGALCVLDACSNDPSNSQDAGSDADGGGPFDAGSSGRDPAPDLNTPGEYGCAGCPDVNITEFEVNAGTVTARTFSGAITGATGDGAFYARGPGGEEVFGPIPTDTTNGTFDFTTPLFCGLTTVKCTWSNAAGQYVAVVNVVTTNCTTADIRVTLTWDDLGDDWELHLIRPGGTINDGTNDCTWNTCMGTSLDWGATGDATDNPLKDIDNTGSYGPENIFLAKPETGTYFVLVEHWASGDPMSDGRVIINLSNGSSEVIEILNLAPQFVRAAATIEWPSGAIRVVDTVYDCTANWSGGCKDSIP